MSVIPDFRRLSKKDPKREVRMDYRVRSCLRADQMAHGIKRPFANTDNLNLIPESCLWRRELTDRSYLLTTTHTTCVWTCIHVCIYTHSK